MQTLPYITKVIDRLRHAKRVLVITGAGISADSGLPTYRGIGGLYNDRDTEDGMSIEEALSGQTMRTSPGITWKYLTQIEENCRKALPNAAHKIIASLQDHVPTTVLTQNIDGFHRFAGSRDLIEIHGNLFDLHCTSCDYETTVPDYSTLGTIPPVCPRCAGLVRPRVVLFGEMLPSLATQRLEEILDEGYDLVFSIGTSAVFPYISQPFVFARQYNALSVEINPSETAVSPYAEIAWRTGAAEALSLLWEIGFETADRRPEP